MLYLALACTSSDPDDSAFVDVGDDGSDGEDDSATGAVPAFTIGTWNLENFSGYGADEWRLADMPGKVGELGADLFALQELKAVAGQESTTTPQAFDLLLDALPEYEGFHNPWDDWDTSVGFLYRPDVVTVLSSQEIFPDDSDPFPRPPLQVEVEITRDGATLDLTVIVLHLKAMDDGLDRRIEACQKLDAYVSSSLDDQRVILLGDLNDDPNEPLETNAFEGTFLDAEPDYVFLTKDLPPESATYTAWDRYVDGEYIPGSFIDHAIATGEVLQSHPNVTAQIAGVEESMWSWWQDTYSDHFPVLFTLAP